MAKNTGVASLAENAITPMVNEMGYAVWDVEYVREGAEMYLRVTIDNEDGIDINDCEKVHRAILPVLDEFEWDHLEVSSPGVERTLRKPSHFDYAVGEKVEIRLFAPDENGNKAYTGTLVSYENDVVTLDVGGNNISIPMAKVGKANIVFDFGKI